MKRRHTKRAPHQLRPYRTYGAWSVQRPGFGTLGRYSPDMVQTQPDGTIDLKLRLDRAAYQLHTENGIPHEQALHNALLCPAWASLYEHTAQGRWEFELQTPNTDRIELVAMLWPQHDNAWPLGEINIVEGRIGTGETMTNLHWPNPETGQPEHDPVMIPVDVSKRHRYSIEVLPGRLRWRIDGKVVRTLHTEHAPTGVPVHLVIQAGVNRSILDDWHPNFEWEQAIQYKPLRAPGLRRR